VTSSKNITFKPLLANIENSATIEETKKYIPIKRSVKVHNERTQLLNTKHTFSNGTINKHSTQKNEKLIKLTTDSPRKYSQSAISKYKRKSLISSINTLHRCKSPSSLAVITSIKSRTHKAIAVTKTATQKKLKSNSIASSIRKDKESSQRIKKCNLELTAEEKIIYGNRFPADYKKLSLLGKGGCALVWLGIKGENKVAVKQFAKAKNLKADIDSWKTEVEINRNLFSSNNPSTINIAKCLDVIEEAKDVWMVYELGGQSLTKQLFEIKGEFFKGERLYKITHQQLYKQFQSNPQLLKIFIKTILETLILFNQHKIIHCDLKPDNILIDNEGNVKVIDFGSSFVYSQYGMIRMTTPEYMPPECLELKKLSRESLAEITQPWSVDMWSLGAILLEIFTGFPQWLSLKGRVESTNKTIISLGVFSSNGKVSEKIIQKQKETVRNIHEVLRRYNSFMKDERLIELLTRMLDLNPMTRISPEEALNFL